MVAAQIPNAKQQFEDINGFPLVSGTVGMYVPSTLIAKNTWSDAEQTILNTNPIILDSRGQAIIYGTGIYRQIVKDQFGNLIWDQLTTATGFSTGVTTVDNVADFVAIPASLSPALNTIYLQGYYAPGDGGEGIFYWNPSDATGGNGGTIFNPTGNLSIGRWNRQFVGPLIDLWFGVKADGVTDNTATLQNCEDAANALGLAVYYPDQKSSRSLTGTITTYSGIHHWGDGMNSLAVASGAINIGGSTIYKPMGSGSVFSFQASTGAFIDIPAPCWRDMNIHAAAGSGITLNSIAGGFTDDLTSQASQDRCSIERVGFDCPSGDHCVGLFKCQSATIIDCIKMGSVNGFYLYGSDNPEIHHNYLELALNGYEINCVAAGATFGNMAWIENNVFETPNSGAIAAVNSSYRSIYIEKNFFEEEPGTYSANACITLTAGINATVRINEVDYPVGGGGNWINITGTFANLDFGGNKTGIANPQTMTFNAGAGHKAYINGIEPVHITADGPLISGIPFISASGSNQLSVQQDKPPVSGAVYWQFNPNISVLDSAAGAYFSSVMVAPSGFYNIPAAAALATQIGFQAPLFNITDTVDVWVIAYSSIASQTLSLVFGGVTYTQALQLSLAWYKVASAVAVSGVNTLRIYNGDTGHGGSCFVGNILVLKH